MFEKINVSDNHTLFEDRVKNLKNEVVWATETATQKAMTTYNSWQNRSPIKRFANIFQGDLAKNVLRSFFEGIGVSTEEYDRIRTDDFKEHDKFDLKIHKNSNFIEIEVKSSFEKTFTEIHDIFQKRNMIINGRGPHCKVTDICYQVFFYTVDTNRNFFKNEDAWSHTNKLEKDLCTRYVLEFIENVRMCICGFVDKKQQLKALEKPFCISDQSIGIRSHTYGTLPLIKTQSPEKISDVLKNLDKQKRGLLSSFTTSMEVERT